MDEARSPRPRLAITRPLKPFEGPQATELTNKKGPSEDAAVAPGGAEGEAVGRSESWDAGETPGAARGRLLAEKSPPAAAARGGAAEAIWHGRQGPASASPPFLLSSPGAPPTQARTPTCTSSSKARPWHPKREKPRLGGPLLFPCEHPRPAETRGVGLQPRAPLTCWPERGLPWGALLKKEVLAVKKKSSASSSRLL